MELEVIFFDSLQLLLDDAHHIVKPLENGFGAFRAMRQALLEARITPSQVNHINCHATSTPLGDEAEIRALEKLIGNTKFDLPQEFQDRDSRVAIEDPIDTSRLRRVTLTANKSQLGHTISASGGIESIILLKSLETGIVPQIMNLEDPICTELNLVRGGHAKNEAITFAVKNAFAFGGINTSLVFENLS